MDVPVLDVPARAVAEVDEAGPAQGVGGCAVRFVVEHDLPAGPVPGAGGHGVEADRRPAMGRGSRLRWRLAGPARAPFGGGPQALPSWVVEVGRHHGCGRTRGPSAQRLVQVERPAPLRQPVLDEGKSVLPAQRLAVPRRTDEAGDPVPVHDERPVPWPVGDITSGGPVGDATSGPGAPVARRVVDPESHEL